MESEQKGTLSKKVLETKLSPLSTLESSFEVLNINKFDVAFTVDPLYHQTSAQFDEGGANGLLLNNLGLYGGCRVIFDSFEVPEKSMAYETHNVESELIDLSFVEEYIQQMLTHMPAKYDISPTLRYIVNQFDENNHGSSDLFSSAAEALLKDDTIHSDLEGHASENYEQWGFDDNGCLSTIDDVSTSTYPNLTTNQVGNDDYTFEGPDIDEVGKVAVLLYLGLGFSSNSNAWAGPDHWKYRNTKSLDQDPISVSRSELETKKVKNRKQGLPDICFTNSLDKASPDIFSPPENPSSLLQPLNRVLHSTTLPEDCHYRPETLLRLFSLPNRMFLGRKGRKYSDESRHQSPTCHMPASWNNKSTTNDPMNDGHAFSDTDDPDTFVCQPHQVNKVNIQYDMVSKQVDVHALKDTLWNVIHDSILMPDKGCDAKVSFKQVLLNVTNNCSDASTKDTSPHLFLICLLHLANDHGLTIHDCPSLDELDIHIPFSALVK